MKKLILHGVYNDIEQPLLLLQDLCNSLNGFKLVSSVNSIFGRMLIINDKIYVDDHDSLMYIAIAWDQATNYNNILYWDNLDLFRAAWL